jgi:splicing factor 3B subunit 3
MVPKLGLKLKQDVIPLSYTPRRFASHPSHPISYVIETDHRAYGQATIDRVTGEKVRSFRRASADVVLMFTPISDFQGQGAGHVLV